MIKLAMIKIHEAFKEEKIQSKMLLQVHDELVFDVLKDEIDVVKPIITRCMETALILPNDVPVVTEVGIGENWLVAH